MCGRRVGLGACMAGEMATAAGGTHPTGMHSYEWIFVDSFCIIIFLFFLFFKILCSCNIYLLLNKLNE